MNDTNLAAARESSRRLADLLRREHVALADFLVALSEFDRAGAYRRWRPGSWPGSPRWWIRFGTGGCA